MSVPPSSASSAGITILGLIIGVILTLELIRFEVLPGGGALEVIKPKDVSQFGRERPTPTRARKSSFELDSSKTQRPYEEPVSNEFKKTVKFREPRKMPESDPVLGVPSMVSKTEDIKPLLSNKDGYRRTGDCKYDFKVYVYPLPGHLAPVRLAEEARRNKTLHICQKCILEQFSLEYVVTDFLTQFCGRTNDPEEADFFYLPLIRDAEYRVTLDHNNKAVKGNRRAPSQAEEALLAMMGDFRGRGSQLRKPESTLWTSYFNVTDKWWNRRGGMDHILVMPAPVTNLRHEGGMRGFFHYMMHLHTPIFLNVEYSRSFVNEYPVCATRKNIIMPYPTTDPQHFNGKLHSDQVDRHSLIYYAGGMHGECVGIRRAIRQVMMNGTKITSSHITPKYRSNQQEREHGMRSATFCPIPIGDSPSSKRMYDVIHFGCIPVVLSDELVYAYSNFSGGPLDDLQYTIRLPQSIIQFPTGYLLKKFGSPKARKLFGHLPDGTSLWTMLEESAKLPSMEEGIYINPLVHILRMVSPQNLKILRRNLAEVEKYYRYYALDKEMRIIPTANKKLPDGGAIEMFARMLSKRKKEGVESIGRLCQEERHRSFPKHKYVGNYPCDRDNANSLMGALNR